MNNRNDTTAVSDNAGTICFTLLQSTERLSKAYTKKADGSVAKNGSTQLKTGAFCVAPFETTAGVAAALSGIGQTIDVLTYKQAIVLGTPKDGRMDGGIVTKDVFTKGVTTAVLTRTLEHFDWPDGLGLLLHDGDDINGLQAILSELYPGFADVALLTRPSASASVIDPATGEAFGCGEHAFAVIDQPRLSKACLQAWLRLAWCCGSGKSGGRLLLGKNGAVHVRGPVDVSVASPERLVYEGAVVANNLTTLPRVSAVVGGLRILRAQDLIDYADRMAPQARYIELVAAAQAKPEFRQRQAAKQAAYAKEHVDKAVARGKPRAQVEAEYTASVAAGTKKIGEWKWQALSDDHVLFKLDGDAFTIADVKRDPVKYHKLNCCDPTEGMDYQSRNCAVIYTDGAHIKIYSRAHGDENAFVATFDETPWKEVFKQLKQAAARKAADIAEREEADAVNAALNGPSAAPQAQPSAAPQGGPSAAPPPSGS